MQIILLEKVVNVGNLGDVVKVKDGYARNFLIPQRMARRATTSAVAEFEVKRAELEKAAAAKLSACQTQGEKLNAMTITIAQKAGVDGRLFGSVTNFDIAEALTKQGFPVEKAQVRLPARWSLAIILLQSHCTPMSSWKSPSPSSAKLLKHQPRRAGHGPA
jgi:large subunit ribosomal protein L9